MHASLARQGWPSTSLSASAARSWFMCSQLPPSAPAQWTASLLLSSCDHLRSRGLPVPPPAAARCSACARDKGQGMTVAFLAMAPGLYRRRGNAPSPGGKRARRAVRMRSSRWAAPTRAASARQVAEPPTAGPAPAPWLPSINRPRSGGGSISGTQDGEAGWWREPIPDCQARDPRRPPYLPDPWMVGALQDLRSLSQRRARRRGIARRRRGTLCTEKSRNRELWARHRRGADLL
jgi:hypothetical protein